MMLPIGNRRPVSGFSLIEVMVTVCVLSIGTVMILQSNIMSLNVFGRYLNRIEILLWADEKMAETKETMVKEDIPDVGTLGGNFETDRRTYDWTMEVKDANVKDLYTMHLDVSWMEDSQPIHLYRDSYFLKIKR